MTPQNLGIILVSPLAILFGWTILQFLWEVVVDYGDARERFKEFFLVIFVLAIVFSAVIGLLLLSI